MQFSESNQSTHKQIENASGKATSSSISDAALKVQQALVMQQSETSYDSYEEEPQSFIELAKNHNKFG